MRSKNLRRVSEVRFKKKLESLTLETSKNHLIRNFLRNGRVRVKIKNMVESIGEFENSWEIRKIILPFIILAMVVTVATAVGYRSFR